MSEPIAVVTIKLTEAELKLINDMIGHHIAEWQEKEKIMSAKYNLQKELLKIEDWVNEEKQASINDKKKPDPKKEYINKITGEKSLKEQTKVATMQRLSVPIED
jgi:hypothetical protein